MPANSALGGDQVAMLADLAERCVFVTLGPLSARRRGREPPLLAGPASVNVRINKSSVGALAAVSEKSASLVFALVGEIVSAS